MSDVTIIIKPGNVGDHLCSLPLYLALAEQQGPLVLVTQTGRIGNPGAAGLFCSWSPFEQIITLDTPLWARANRPVLGRIRTEYRPKQILHIPVENYPRLRAVGLSIFWTALFAKKVIGFLSVTDARQHDELERAGRLDNEVSRLLDWGETRLGIVRVDIRLAVSRWLAAIEENVEVPELPQPFVLIAAASNDSVKQWPLDRYVAVAQSVQGELGATPVWIGGEADPRRLQGNGQELPGVSLVGRTTLEQTLSLISKAQLVICNDSMAGHMAAVTGTPCVSVFSARTLPGLWWPDNAQGTVIQKRVPCEGCELREISDCPNSHVCMMDITAHEVLSHV